MLKHMSIKTRVIFWYTFTMFMFTALIFTILIFAGRRAAQDDAQASLIISTDMALNNVTVSEGRLIVDDDFIYYMDHTWIILAKDDGVMISGLTPEDFPSDIPFEEDRIRQVGDHLHPFYVYDRLIENQKIGKIWIRGMTPASLSVRDPAINSMIHLFMIVLPILILLSLAGGWLITRRAFLPLKQINDTVMLIQEGKDLSRRIGVDESYPRDEIQITANVFDQMLDRIGASFEREKQFTDDASHELRTPVAVIQAQCEYALENSDKPKETAAAIQVIHEQAKKMSALIEQLLMLARADRAAVILKKEPVDISLLAEESAALLTPKAYEKNITVSVHAPEGLYTQIDPNLMEKAIVNLIDNAIKYGKKNGSVIITAEKQDLNSSPSVLLSVTDDGIGITEENLPHIWDRFYRVDPTGEEKGTGLGLPLVRWIVEAHGGQITVDSEPGRFTKFCVILPVNC